MTGQPASLLEPAGTDADAASAVEQPPAASADAATAPGPVGLFGKLAEVFAELEDVARDKRHENQGWSYASADAVKRAVRDLLRQRRVLVLPATRGTAIERPFKTSGGKDRVVVTVGLTFTLVDADTGETWTCDWQGSGADDAEKGLSKAITVGQRTFLKDLFLLPDGEDTSGSPSGGGSAPYGRGFARGGEPLCSEDEMQEVYDAAKTRLSISEFLNVLLDARGIDRVNVTDDQVDPRQIQEQLGQLTKKQAAAVLKVLAAAGDGATA